MAKHHSAIREAAEYDTDSMAAAALRDMHEEEGTPLNEDGGDGLPTPWKAQRGDWVVIFTGAFFHVGQLLGEDHEYYYLAPGHSQIFETGSFESFFGKGIAGACETIPGFANVRKGPTTHVAQWPHNRPAKTNKE
jgi:hypothetical protein